MDQDSSANLATRDRRAPAEPVTPPASAAPTDGIASRLPRPETTCLLLALLCTIGAKLIAVQRHFPEDLLTAALAVVSSDFLFFVPVIALVTLGYRIQPRPLVARLTLTLAVVVVFWSLLNCAWLLATGVQLQPGILPALGYDPRQFLGIIEEYVLRYWPIALACTVAIIAVIGWIVFRLIRPLPSHGNSTRPRHLPRTAVMFALLMPAAWGLNRVSVAQSKLSFETHAALGFSSHFYALASLFTGPSERVPDESDTREPPRAGSRHIGLPTTPPGEMPNIVLILLESISRDSTSLGRSHRDTTPFLQEIAAQGAEFVRTRVPVSQTGKAYWSTLTGTTPEIYHDYSEALLVDEPYESLATVLGKVGYRSAFFEMSNGTFECAPAVFANMGFDYGWWFENLEDPSAALGYLAGDDFRMIDPAMQWAGEQGQPFLLTMITSVAHDPFELPDWYGESTGDRFEDYLQTVRFTDDFVREIDARLRERGIADDTILCVLGDHGESFRADARRGRWVPYEEVIRIPWVLRWPGHVEAGHRIDWPCSQMDVTPTLLTLLGFDISRAGYDGRDALTPASPDRRLYFSSWFDQSPLGFVEGNRKVVYWPYLDQVGQYDLAADPGELGLQPLEGEKRDAAIADVTQWRMNSRMFFDARRFRERVVFDHWHLFASGRSAWAYYEP